MRPNLASRPSTPTTATTTTSATTRGPWAGCGTPAYRSPFVLCSLCWLALALLTAVSARLHSLARRGAGLYTGPYIDAHNVTNATVQLGTHAYLPCRVKQIGSKAVSWVRASDNHILAVDREVFVEDNRFQSLFWESTSTWTLVIKYARQQDEGDYECQVSTEPKLSHMVHLTVVVPKVEILGDRDRYVKIGSTVVLQCVVKHSLEMPFYVLWYHESRQLAEHRHKIIITTKILDGSNDTGSNLTISNAGMEDSGNYTCRPSNLDSTSVLLHVLNGEHPAAIQRGSSSSSGSSGFVWWLAAAAVSLPGPGEPARRSCASLLLIAALILAHWLHRLPPPPAPSFVLDGIGDQLRG